MVHVSLIITLLISGIILVIYPKWDDERVRKQQLSLVAEWDHVQLANASAVTYASDDVSVDSAHLIDSGSMAIEHEQTGEPHVNTKTSEEALDIETDDNEPKFEPIPYHGESMIGKLMIESIEVEQPILSRATEHALNLGVGNVIEDRSPGEVGNFVLAGHRGRSYGRLLNRLHELEQGDVILLDTIDGTFEYEVSDFFLVTPDDLSVLDEQEDVKELTLITCHPVRNPTHRLIIKAVQKS